MSTPSAILITGCAGFIGSAFAKRWKQAFPEAPMVGVDDFSTGRRDAVLKEMTFYEGSVADSAFLDKIFKQHRIDIIFHFAAIPRVGYSVEHPSNTLQSNIASTVLLLEKARDFAVKRFIYSSSCAVYGASVERPHKEEESPLIPISPYGLEKYVGEQYCNLFSRLFGLDTVCLRYFNVFGPGQYGGSPYSGVISAWLSGACSHLVKPSNTRLEDTPLHQLSREGLPLLEEGEGEVLTPLSHTECNVQEKSEGDSPLTTLFLEGDGTQSRDFCFVDNVVDANLLAFQAGQKFHGDVFNIGSGEEIDLLTLKHSIEEYIERELVLEKRPARVGDIQQSLADITKARDVLGYVPRINFAEGIKKTFLWAQEGCRQEAL